MYCRGKTADMSLQLMRTAGTTIARLNCSTMLSIMQTRAKVYMCCSPLSCMQKTQQVDGRKLATAHFALSHLSDDVKLFMRWLRTPTANARHLAVSSHGVSVERVPTRVVLCAPAAWCVPGAFGGHVGSACRCCANFHREQQDAMR